MKCFLPQSDQINFQHFWFKVFILCGIVIVFFPCFAQDTTFIHQTLTPLEQVLNMDGSVRLEGDFHGALDVRVWQMRTGSDGKPRFLRNSETIDVVPEDSLWDDRFGVPGMNDWVDALAVIGTELYAAGRFTTAGSDSANYIAKWDGTSWTALGSGMNDFAVDPVHALAVIGSDLYVGGEFHNAGGVSADYIAKWDGTSWSGLGSGMNDAVRALVGIGTDLYAGGESSTT